MMILDIEKIEFGFMEIYNDKVSHYSKNEWGDIFRVILKFG